MAKQPLKSFYDIECDICADPIMEEEEFYFVPHGKDKEGGRRLCPPCANEEGVVCPDCGGLKKPDFDICYPCYAGETH